MPGDRTLQVEVVSRYGGEAWAGAATRVAVPLPDGELGVLPGRQPILAVLGRGSVRIAPIDGDEVSMPVAGGFCSVDGDVVTVAADAVGTEVTDSTVAVSDVIAETIVIPGVGIRD
ncbi:F0F1 ATP synthase subunit epsilon [Actinomyces procaprae]|uniref:F0F1 ATP synthase subunit epsilon n=1 Tax=Actinomyces procaprae TaxID=2560010 RepID=UPI00109DAABA|nr:F0F1 ATP synthase subunit epsilon [Actinomyces procaprae]